MLLMSRLLKNTILLSSLVSVTLSAKSDYVTEYLTNQLENNPAVKEGSVKVVEKKPLKQIQGWEAYILDVDVTLKRGGKKVHQKNIVFSDGRYIASDFIDTRTGRSLKDLVKPSFALSMYDDANRVAGDKDAKHRIVVFSDPLCPFCKRYMPQVIEDVKKDPKKYVLYHYSLPLTRLHPASEFLVKAEIAARLQGKKIDLHKLYTAIDPRNKDAKNFIAYNEKDPQKILKVFNAIFGTHLTPADLEKPAVLKRYKEEQALAEKLLVSGTPTVYFDEKYDRSRKEYKKVK